MNTQPKPLRLAHLREVTGRINRCLKLALAGRATSSLFWKQAHFPASNKQWWAPALQADPVTGAGDKVRQAPYPFFSSKSPRKVTISGKEKKKTGLCKRPEERLEPACPEEAPDRLVQETPGKAAASGVHTPCTNHDGNTRHSG